MSGTNRDDRLSRPEDSGRESPPSTRRRFRPNAPRPGEQRREALLDSLENLLRDTPSSELTIEIIASAASLSRTSVYFYFGSKAEAIDALIARASEEMLDGMYARAPREPLAAFTERVVAAALEGWRRRRPVFVAAVEQSSQGDRATARWREVMRVFSGRLAAALVIEADDPAAGAAVGEAEAERRAEIVCWMIERNFYFLFTRDHAEDEEDSLAATLTEAALAVLTMDGAAARP